MGIPAKVIEFRLPKRRPKVIEKEAPPDQRKFAVVPMRAATDTELHGFSMKVLVLLCSYANRAGITWVGQQRIADHLGVAKQQVARAMKQLRDRGHVEIMSKGFRGERANTVRIIYDPEIKAEDAISIASAKEDSRPPEMVKREVREMTLQNQPRESNLQGEEDFTPERMAANRARLKEMLGGLSGRDGFHHNKPERMGDIMARKPRARKATIDNTQVVNDTPSIDNIIDNTGVVQTQKNIGYIEVIRLYEERIKRLLKEKNNIKVDKTTVKETDIKFAALLCEVGCPVDKYTAALEAMTEPVRLGDLCEGLIHG